MGLKLSIQKWRTYAKMSDLGIIARRKFFNNCFDGALTCAGIVSGAFVLFLFGGGTNSPNSIVILGFSTALAIGISGLWGAFLSEEAERKKKILDLKREMVIIESEDVEDSNKIEKEKLEIEKKIVKEKQIEKAMVLPKRSDETKVIKNIQINAKVKKSKNNKTMVEQAERFATIVASIVDGAAPALGSTLPLIPFFFGISLNIFHFIFSYSILLGLLIYLGIFLGNISGQGRVKYALHLVTAGLVTLVVSLMLSLATGNL